MRETLVLLLFIVFLFTGGAVNAQIQKQNDLKSTTQSLQIAFENGEFKEAKKLAQRAIELTEENYGPEAKQSLEPTVVLANVLANLGEYGLAKETYLKAFTLTRKHFGDSSPEMLQVRANHIYNMNSIRVARSYANDDKYFKQLIDFWGFEFGKAKKMVRPNWPRELKETYKSFQIRVVVKVDIDESGKVTAAEGAIGDPALFPYAVEAAMKMEFEPTIKNGTAVAVTNHVIFVLRFRTTL